MSLSVSQLIMNASGGWLSGEVTGDRSVSGCTAEPPVCANSGLGSILKSQNAKMLTVLKD